MICNRPGAINIGVDANCRFLVPYINNSLKLVSEVIEDTAGTKSYYATFTGPTTTGATIQLVLVTLNGGIYSTYVTEYTSTADMTIDAFLTAVKDKVNTTWAGTLSATTTPGTLRVVPISGGDMYGGNAYTSGGASVCYAFEEVIPEDRSLTFSYYPASQNWMYLHAYAPNDYGRDRVDCFAFEAGNIYRMNHGPRGNYTGVQYPFIIEMVFRADNEIIIDNVMWRSVIDNTPFNSFTHITVSTRHFSTGRVAINERKIQGWFSFNKNRDIVINLPFRSDVYNDFSTIGSAIDPTRAWFKRGLIADQYCVVRLEYHGGENIVFLEANAQTTDAYR